MMTNEKQPRRRGGLPATHFCWHDRCATKVEHRRVLPSAAGHRRGNARRILDIGTGSWAGGADAGAAVIAGYTD